MHKENNQEKIKKYLTIEEAFEAMLGIAFPEEPVDLPNEIVLDKKLFGGLLEAILKQELDDPKLKDGSARERSQFVGFLTKKGVLENSKVITGSETRTGDAMAELMRWFRPILGHKSKPLTYWHTHTHKADSPILTESDIAQRLGEDRKCVIYLHASPTEITAIFQTKKAIPKRMPISTAKKGFSFYDELKKFYDSSSNNPRLSDLATFLEKQGYTLYMWRKPNNIRSVREGIENGEFTEGIKLNKIGEPKYMRELKGVNN